MKPKSLLTIAFILTFALTAFISDDTFEIGEIIGVIETLDDGAAYISGETLFGDLGSALIELGDAPVYNLLTGLPVLHEELLIGMEVRIAYALEVDAIPQAITLWLYPNNENAAVFTARVSENIQYGPDYCSFLSSDGRYRIILYDDSYIFDPFMERIHPTDIIPGQEFFVWVDMITASSPSLVYPDKVVMICQLPR